MTDLDADIQAILDMSDDEILADARARGIDPEQNAKECRALFERAKLIADKNMAYTERDKCLVLMALMAQRLGLKVGIGLDPKADTSEWASVLFIDLPAGQVSWHIHESETAWFYFVGAYGGQWDGHTTDEKYERVLTPGL